MKLSYFFECGPIIVNFILTGLLMQRAGFGYSQIWEQITTFRAVVNLASTSFILRFNPGEGYLSNGRVSGFLARIGRTTAITLSEYGGFIRPCTGFVSALWGPYKDLIRTLFPCLCQNIIEAIPTQRYPSQGSPDWGISALSLL